jgi:glycosyltransferase involved in cell wall biosynthesis
MTSQYKILIDSLVLDDKKAGIGNYIFCLINELIKGSINIQVTVLINERYRYLFTNNIDSQVTFMPFNIRGNAHRIMLQYLIHLFTKINYDIYICPDYQVPLFLSRKVKVIAIIPDLSIYNNRKYYNIWSYLIKAIGYRIALKRADALITYSTYVKDSINKRFPKYGNYRIYPIWLGVPQYYLEKEKISDIEEQEIRDKYNLPRTYFLFVGTIMPRKNLVSIIKAFTAVHNIIEDDMVIVGSKGWKNTPLFNSINNELIFNRIRFLNYVPDNKMPALYKLAKFLVFPSYEEGFGLPIIEAFSMGCPVITSNLGAMKEIADNSAYLVDPFSLEDIRKAILLFSKNEKIRADYSKMALSAASKYRWEKTLAEYSKVFSEVLSNDKK